MGEVFTIEKTIRFWLAYAQKMKAGGVLNTKKDFSKTRFWISPLTVRSKNPPGWKMALDELLKGLFRQ